jgi:hypothetical protein
VKAHTGNGRGGGGAFQSRTLPGRGSSEGPYGKRPLQIPSDSDGMPSDSDGIPSDAEGIRWDSPRSTLMIRIPKEYGRYRRKP